MRTQPELSTVACAWTEDYFKHPATKNDPAGVGTVDAILGKKIDPKIGVVYFVKVRSCFFLSDASVFSDVLVLCVRIDVCVRSECTPRV